MAYRMAPVLVTLNDPEGHSPVAGLFKCNPSNICAAFYQISTDRMLAWFLSDIWASCFACQMFFLLPNEQYQSIEDTSCTILNTAVKILESFAHLLIVSIHMLQPLGLLLLVW